MDEQTDIEFELGSINDEAPLFSDRQKFLFFDILVKHNATAAIKESKSGMDSRIDISKIPNREKVIMEIYQKVVLSADGDAK